MINVQSDVLVNYDAIVSEISVEKCKECGSYGIVVELPPNFTEKHIDILQDGRCLTVNLRRNARTKSGKNRSYLETITFSSTKEITDWEWDYDNEVLFIEIYV